VNAEVISTLSRAIGLGLLIGLQRQQVGEARGRSDRRSPY
jgi:uncharacterized membrane protein YhiD involved in acid resistance